MQFMLPIRQSYLSSKEIIGYALNLKPILETIIGSDPYLARQMAIIADLHNRGAVLSGRTFTNTFTQHVKQSDENRDTIYTGLLTTLHNNIALSTLFPEKATYSQMILTTIEANPVDISAGYAVESVQLEQLLDLLNALDSEVLTKAGVLEIVEALTIEEQKFSMLFQKKIDEEAKKELGSVRQVAKLVFERLINILTYMGSNAVDLPDEYLAIAEKVNELTQSVMIPAKARKKRADSEE